jgi:ubiquinone/menaquinone biosynthesis C-methylase UbiE
MSAEFWDAVAPVEEQDLDDEAINRALRWREIERHLAGVETVLDVGGATGAFSIALAERGFRVTHVDVSTEMLERARAHANTKGVTLELVQADARDLSRFADRQFDLVLAMDGAISFAGELAPVVIAESCRVTGRTLIVTVSNKACMVPTWIKYSMKAANRILPAVHEMMRTGTWHKDQFPDNALVYPSVCDIATFKAFTSSELAGLLREAGLTVSRVGGIGSLTHLLMPHGSPAIPTDELVALCEAYDSAVLPDGPGSFRRAGLIAVAHR